MTLAYGLQTLRHGARHAAVYAGSAQRVTGILAAYRHSSSLQYRGTSSGAQHEAGRRWMSCKEGDGPSRRSHLVRQHSPRMSTDRLGVLWERRRVNAR